MNEGIHESNRFLMMISILKSLTMRLNDEAPKLKVGELDHKWQELLSTFYDTFIYAQEHNIDLREYKEDIRLILDDLYNIQKSVVHRTTSKVQLIDDLTRVVIFTADKIDNILEGIGWKRVVRPITEAIFMIPRQIIEMVTGKTEASVLLPDTIREKLPPPVRTLPESSGVVQSGEACLPSILEGLDEEIALLRSGVVKPEDSTD
jgi:hypothetical protein